MPDDQYDVFIKTIRENLPVTFRITSSKGESKRLLEIVKEKLSVDYMSGIHELVDGDDESMKPKSLSWYPNELAWQLELTRKDIRRSEKLFRLHNFLIAETKSGNISRQEAVSMIPPLVLDVQPHHKCLDLCAAPGSKTAQIIEALHSDGSGNIPKGFVIANDVDNKRCYMLVHQAKRLNSPCLLITNAEAGQFPNLFTNNHDDGELTLVKFDRVLADVPCSGDGTMRKNPDIWLKWSQQQALNLHGVQYRIARRGAELLEVGGRMVYSTCSLNPIENEAVLCRLLREANGSLELVDASDAVKGLKYNPGMTYWEPASKDLRFFKSWDELPVDLHTLLHREMFAPPTDEVAKYNLQHCIRVLPHQQNTGAFFVSVLVKKALMPWEAEVNQKAVQSNARKIAARSKDDSVAVPVDDEEETPRKKKKMHYGFREDPFVFFTENEEVYQQLKGFYELRDDFKPTCLLTRCATGKKKNIYFCSPEVRSMLRINEPNIKLINSGVKTFSRCDNRNMECSFRLAHEGLHNVDQFIGDKRRIHVTREDLILMLNNLNPLEPPQVADLTEQTRIQHAASSSGSCVLHFKNEDMELHLVGWRGNKTLRAYIDVNDSVHMLRLLDADLSKYGNP